MKSKVFKFGLGSFFIVLMLVTALFLLRPIYNALNSTLNQIIEKYTYILEEKFNLELKIGSISPNILTKLKISDIEVLDATTKEKIISIDSVIVRYRLNVLLGKSKDAKDFDLSFIQDFLTSITVNQTNVHWDSVENSSVLEKIVAFVEKQKEEKSDIEEKSAKEEKNNFDFVIPCEIVLKNTNFLVSHNQNIATLKLPTITLRQKYEEQIATSIDFNGKISLLLPLGILDSPLELTSNVIMQVILSKNLEGSIARLQLSSASGEDFSLNGLDFAADYTDKTISCRVFSAGVPFSVFLGYHTEFKELELAINATKFDPFDFISIKDKNSILAKAKGSSISGSYKLSYSLSGKDLTFFANGELFVSKSLFKGGINASYNIFGNLSKISVNKLICKSDVFDVDFNGSFDVKTLSPEGEIFINRVVLPSGKDLSAEIYVDSLSQGFICFIPQLIAGDNFLTALQLTCIPHNKSLDFNFEAYDYSHYEVENPGKIAAAGSVFFEDKTYLQTSVSLENAFISGILQFASNFVKNPESLTKPGNGFLSPYIVSLDLYASSDFSSISYNLPYAVVANTERDGEMLLLSLNGNETSVQVSRLDVTAFGQELSSSFSIDTDKKYEDIYFSSNFVLNSIPYNFYGAFSKNEFVTLSGDYGFNFSLDLTNKNMLWGNLEFEAMPIKLGDFLFTAENSTNIHYFDKENWVVNFENFKLIEESNKIKNNPTVTLAARLDPIGLQIDSIAYGDSISVVEGIGSVNWNLQDGILTGASALLQMESASTDEKILVDFSASNPFLKSFSSGNFAENFFLTGQISIEKFLFSHILDNQDNNTLSLNISTLGPLNNMLITLDIPEAAIKTDNTFINIDGRATLEDKIVSSQEINVKLGFMKGSVNDLYFSLQDFNGYVLGSFSINENNFKFNAPFQVGFTPFILGDISNFVAEVVFPKIEASFLKPIENFSVKAIRTPGRFDFIGGKTDSIRGYFLDSGEINAVVTGDFPILFDGYGSIKEKKFDLYVNNIFADLGKIYENVTIDLFTLDNGLITGNAHLGGILLDPEISGEINIDNLEIGLSNYVKDKIVSDNIKILATDSNFNIDNTILKVGKGEIGVSAKASLDRWSLDEVLLQTKTLNNTLLAMDCKIPMVDFSANVACDLQMHLTQDNLDLRGMVDTKDTIIALTLSNNNDDSVDSSKETKKSKSPREVTMDLVLNIAPKSKLFYPSQDNPLVRGLVSATKPIHLVLDSSGFSISGDLTIKGGEVLYLSRNFYLKQGHITMNETHGNFDPLITFRAEIPEQDEYGEVVRIILSAENQRLKSLNPVLSSDPMKSDLEIRNLLGQAFIGDTYESVGTTVGQFAATGLDFLLQNSVFRQIENRLRDLFNFDIFSFRTQFFQEALKQVFGSGNSSVNDQGIALDPGNFFNNTTVYIGKYIGNTIYMDAMFSLVYKKDGENPNKGKMILQPEIGLELPTPFVNIRWSIAPDITSAQNLWVPYTSISLTWKFSF